MAINQWPDARGTGGRMLMESVAEWPWNGWPNSRGIRSQHQQPQPGRAGLSFPELRFGMPVPARQRPQVSVDAAFRAANQVSQCAQALFALGGDSGENGAASRPYGLSRRVFL